MGGNNELLNQRLFSPQLWMKPPSCANLASFPQAIPHPCVIPHPCIIPQPHLIPQLYPTLPNYFQPVLCLGYQVFPSLPHCRTILPQPCLIHRIFLPTPNLPPLSRCSLPPSSILKQPRLWQNRNHLKNPAEANVQSTKIGSNSFFPLYQVMKLPYHA